MDRGVWQAAISGITKVGHDLATKPPPPLLKAMLFSYLKKKKKKKAFLLLKYWSISFTDYSFKALAKISLIKIEAQVFQSQDFS